MAQKKNGAVVQPGPAQDQGAQAVQVQAQAQAAAPEATAPASAGSIRADDDDFPAVFLLVCMYQGGLSKRHSDEQSQRGCAVTLRTFLLVNDY